MDVPGPSSLLPSTSNRSSTRSARSARSGRVSAAAVDTVITVPPWARDEPPSPQDSSSVHCSDQPPRPSAAASYSSFGHPSQLNAPSRWWPFTLPRNQANLAPPSHDSAQRAHRYPEEPNTPRPTFSFRDRRSISWLHPSLLRHLPDGEQTRQDDTLNEPPHDWNIQNNVPVPMSPFTLSHSRSPGWDIPWAPKVDARTNGSDINYFRNGGAADGDVHTISSKWCQRKKRLRAYILNHHLVPLLFRFTNIIFTSAALAVAIRIRSLEAHLGVIGAVGSSATIVIIFAPLTLVHVMIAIYLDYFGRPVGLWLTSLKLAHTLSDVFFICTWSASLSLCSNDFFTSLVPCSSRSNTSWYSKLPRPTIPQLQNLDRKSSSSICRDQLALIWLVGVGLITYCANLVINLYRIFEKMKYHPPSTTFS